jgi:serine/threonine protein kinase
MSDSAAPNRADTPNALNPGTRLGEFELLKVLGVGGFGIVYLAMDHALEREIAIKEYMPATLAGRTEAMQVSIRSQSDAESFALGLKSFVNEAKLLARFDHPSLLKVHRFWEANGTAYMAMPVLRGRTIQDVRADMGGPPDEAWLRGVLMPLLGAIEKLHSEGVYHRDIAPDNIQIEPDGRPVLLDFGAARRVLSDKTQSLTAILKPAYAPIEQYGEAGSVKQGPWTDIYALGATLHYVLLRRPPAPATARALDDDHPALTVDRLPGCSERFLAIIDWMLRPRPGDRPQSVAELREVLEGRAPVPQRGLAAALRSSTQPWERTDVLSPPSPPPGPLDLEVGDVATQIVPRTRAGPSAVDLDTGDGVAEPVQPSVPPLEMAAEREAPAPVRRSQAPLVLAGLAALGVAAYLFWPKPEAPAAVASPLPVASAPASPASAPAALGVAGAGAVSPAPADAAAATVLSASAPDAAPAAAASVAADPAAIRPAAEAPVQAVVVPPPPARPVQKPVDKPAPRKEPRPVEAAKAPARPEPVPAGPGPNCGPGEGVRYHVCMGRECASAAFASHPACQRWKADAGR